MDALSMFKWTTLRIQSDTSQKSPHGISFLFGKVGHPAVQAHSSRSIDHLRAELKKRELRGRDHCNGKLTMLLHACSNLHHWAYNSILWCTGFILIFSLVNKLANQLWLSCWRWMLATEKGLRSHRSHGGIGLQTLECSKNLGRSW